MNYDLTEEELPSDEMLAAANGPTFEDLAIDDSLSDLARVAKYSCSSIALQRVIHVKMLADTARAVGFQQACDVLIPLLEPLVCDVEYVVRQHVALQFPPLCSFLVESDPTDGYRVLLDKMIPLVSKLVSDKQHEVRSAANDSLVAIASLVQPEDQGQYVLTIVLPLAHDDDNEQFRISAISLYHGLAEHLGPELCQQFCVPELISLSEDPVFRVRKSTAQSFSSICKIAGQEISRERLLPAFQRLAHDDIWAVRKACVESLVSISESLALEDRGGLLIPLYESFLSDSSRWVRLAAFQSLGPFLASLERKDVSDEMLQHFTGMATSSASAAQLGGSGEVDMRFHCAYSFPAIVSILGKDEWPKLSSIFDGLSQDSFWKVRRTFAYSLHELARILGPEIAEAQLATAFDAYLKDVPDVKMGAMVHFADFLEQVLPSFRESYLPVLTELLNGLIADQTKWRTREILSLQLPQLCTLFSEESTFSAIYPLAVKLITDDVAVVRHRSVQACPLLIERISNKQEWLDDLLEKVKTLAVSPCFTDRQVFVLVSQAMLTAECENVLKLFETDLAPVFFSLASDSVSNVRIVFADMLLTHKDKLLALDSCPEILRGLFAADQPTFSTSEELMTRVGELLPPVKPVGTTSTQAQESTPALDLATKEAITDAGADSGSECIEKAVAPVEVAEVEVEVADASSPST